MISDKRKEKIQFLWEFTNHITLKSKKKKHHLKSDIILVTKKENRHQKPDLVINYTNVITKWETGKQLCQNNIISLLPG